MPTKTSSACLLISTTSAALEGLLSRENFRPIALCPDLENVEQLVFFNVDSSTIEAFALVDRYVSVEGAPTCVKLAIISHRDQLAAPVMIDPSLATSIGLFALALHHEPAFVSDVDMLLSMPAKQGVELALLSLRAARALSCHSTEQREAIDWLTSDVGRRVLAVREELDPTLGEVDREEVGDSLTEVPKKWGLFANTTKQKISLLFLLNSLWSDPVLAPPGEGPR
jgi:hypothetical protein